MTPRILIIAGSDSGGGAGIQADIKTVTMLGGHAMTAVTAVTAQNTREVTAVQLMPPSLVGEQILAVYEDIGVDAIKIGMLGSAQIAEQVFETIRFLKNVPIVLDPVMVATSGARLADSDTVAVMENLARIASVVTPNLPELAVLCGYQTIDPDAVESHASLYAPTLQTPVLVKGGHADGVTISDFLVSSDGRVVARWSDNRIDTTSTHGTGCTLASAIAVGLAEGMALTQAIARARLFVRAALLAAPGFGGGHGPMGHQAVRL